MSIMLPTFPQPAQADPSYMDWGGVIGSPLGGADQKLNRLGDRFALTVTMPPIDSFDSARVWISALIRAQKEGAVFSWPQPGFVVGGPGSPVVDGAGQAGTTLNVRGGAAGYVYRVGQMISVVHAGRRYLHLLAADRAANGSGQVALLSDPMMRKSYANGSPVEVADPKIEGFLEGNSRDWTIDLALNVGLSFKITEAE